MRHAEDGGPLVHRVVKPVDPAIEARLGLDQLLAKSEALRSREAREKAAKALDEETDAIRARRIAQAAALAARFEWKPVASVAIFEVQTCSNCGKEHSVFRGWATRMERKADSNIKRLAAAPCLDRGLPLETDYLESSASVCIQCLQAYALNLEAPAYEFHPTKRADE